MPPQPGTEDHHQMLNKYRFFRESFYLVGKYIHQGIGQNTSRKANPTSGEVGQMKETLGQQDAYRHGNDETSQSDLLLPVLALCSGLMEPDTFMRDNIVNHRGVNNDEKNAVTSNTRRNLKKKP